jgi:mannose/fructose/N-acetylgalactosamine-specific phosphotransferase system component IIC
MKIPLKPGVSPKVFWLTLLSGLLVTALTTLPLIEVAWGAGALIGIGFAYKVVQSLKNKNAAPAPDQTLEDDNDHLE